VPLRDCGTYLSDHTVQRHTHWYLSTRPHGATQYSLPAISAVPPFQSTGPDRTDRQHTVHCHICTLRTSDDHRPSYAKQYLPQAVQRPRNGLGVRGIVVRSSAEEKNVSVLPNVQSNPPQWVPGLEGSEVENEWSCACTTAQRTATVYSSRSSRQLAQTLKSVATDVIPVPNCSYRRYTGTKL
jgi:hypothetical protein